MSDDTTVSFSCAKTAEPIEVLFRLWAWMGSRNHVLGWVQIPHANEQFLGESS